MQNQVLYFFSVLFLFSSSWCPSHFCLLLEAIPPWNALKKESTNVLGTFLLCPPCESPADVSTYLSVMSLFLLPLRFFPSVSKIVCARTSTPRDSLDSTENWKDKFNEQGQRWLNSRAATAALIWLERVIYSESVKWRQWFLPRPASLPLSYIIRL